LLNLTKINAMKIREYLWRKCRSFVLLMSSCVAFAFLVNVSLHGQTEMMAWGNINGIRVDGELMEFRTSVCLLDKDQKMIAETEKERQQPQFSRKGLTQTVNTKLGEFMLAEAVSENGRGGALLNLSAEEVNDTLKGDLYFCIELPGIYYSQATTIFSKSSGAGKKVDFARVGSRSALPLLIKSSGFSAVSSKRNLSVAWDTVVTVLVIKNPDDANIQIFVPLVTDNSQRAKRNFTFKADGIIDNTPVEVAIDCNNPGARFDGFGGNFRLQNPELDPMVIQYCLDNMRVAWGRVEMPWQLWHPEENVSPVEYALSGKLHPHVKESMEMAQKLTALGIPLIISDWSAPKWAIIGELSDAYKYRYKGIFGYPLNPEKTTQIYNSIADYLVFLKQHYGVEPEYFSFNESDLGIDIRHTGKEHAEFIRGIGETFAARGIKTKLLLGDNSDATTFDFILPALNDPSVHKYIGAISFHSWRGCDDATLEKWAGAARKMNVPLIVAEGSTDAAAWSYPEIFYEQAFALYEINLYTRLCRICQPKTILQWQLTSDYSVLSGKGIFKTQGPLTPSQRFWNLKQLSSTPENAFALPVQCNKTNVNCAAFGNVATGAFAIHMVNNGARCDATVEGIPAQVKRMEIFVTNAGSNMKSAGVANVIDGAVSFRLEEAGFTTLISVPSSSGH
jgi:hypothetical protein